MIPDSSTANDSQRASLACAQQKAGTAGISSVAKTGLVNLKLNKATPLFEISGKSGVTTCYKRDKASEGG